MDMKIEGVNVLSVRHCCEHCSDWLVGAIQQVGLCETGEPVHVVYAPVHRARTWRAAMDWALSDGQDGVSSIIRGYYGL